MTTISEWIATRRKAYATAKPGPWNAKTDRRGSRWLVDAPGRLGLVTEVADVWDLDDAHLIVDARTSLPAAVDALEAVLKLHADAGESQGYTAGVYGVIERCCRSCGSHGEYGVSWPCPTVRMIAAVLGVEVDS